MKETKKHTLVRYILLILFVAGYFLFTINKFGFQNGFLVSGLTWSFFVFCTPIADAGFILAFPVRLLIGIRMIYTQIFSFILAFFITIFAINYNIAIFQKTLILNLYHQILFQPFPFWIIIILSLAGTFFSIYFGDELIDVSTHKEREKYHKHVNRHKIIASLSIFLLTVVVYKFLLNRVGIDIPLF